MKKNILIISPQSGKIFENESAGGSERSLIDIFQKFEAVTFYVVGNKNYTLNVGKNKIIFVKNKVMYYFLLPYNIIRNQIIISRALAKSTPLIFIISKFFNKKTVYFIAHDSDTGKKSRYAPGYYSWVPLITFPFVNLIITQTKKQTSYLKKKYPLKNIIHLEKAVTFYPEKQTNKIIRKNVLWVGRQDKIKGIDILINLIKETPEIKYTIIGVSSKEKFKNAIFLNRVNFKDMEKYYLSSKFLISTSHIEGGIPFVFFEALLCKLPIISYKINSENFLEKSKSGFCANGDFDNFVKLVEKYYFSDKIILENMGCSGYIYIYKKHNMNNYIKELKKILYD